MRHFLPVLAFCAFVGGQSSQGPCSPSVYRQLSSNTRSTGYRLGPTEQGACDHNLQPGWYRFTAAAGGKMPERCPRRGQCGTVVPVWINQSHPEVWEGAVSRFACADSGRTPSSGDTSCCSDHLVIGVQNCGLYFVYYLHPTLSCFMAYCAGDKAVCADGSLAPFGSLSKCSGSSSSSGGNGSTSGGSSSTSGGSHGGSSSSSYPHITMAPTLSGPIVLEHNFHFTCDINYPHSRAGLMFEVEWTFSGHADPSIPVMHVADPLRQATLPGSSLRGHLGKRVGCRVRGYYQSGGSSSPSHRRRSLPSSPWISSRNSYFAGITVTPQYLTVSKAGGSAEVTLRSTVPVVCDHQYRASCCIHLQLQSQGGSNSVQVPNQACSQPLCSGQWNRTTSSASTTVTLRATRNGVPSCAGRLRMNFEPLVPVGGGMYLNCFSNYTIPPAQVAVHDSRPFSCTWKTDPHFRGFNGQQFDLFSTGDYTVYKSDLDNFEVQARTIKCAGQTSCQCGVAIREENDVIRISNCGGGRTPSVEVAHQPLRHGTLIQRSSDGRHFFVQMPSGRSVKVDLAHGWYTTTLTLPGSDKGKGGRGVCGDLTGNSGTQFTHSNGHVDSSACRRQGGVSFRSGHQCVPGFFLQSWQNSQSSSLFYNHPHLPTSYHNGRLPSSSQHFCQCDASSSSSSSSHPQTSCTPSTTAPAQVCTGPCRNVTSQVPPWVNAQWQSGRRDVGIFQDVDEPDSPVNLTETSPSGWQKNWPTASGITENQAAEYCLQALRTSQLYASCRDFDEIFDFSLQSCVMDILFADTVEVVEASVAGYTSNCQFEMMQDINNYLTDSDGTLRLQSHVTEVCSVTCLRHGHCVRGRCVCDAGYTGDNCQLLAGKGPELSRIRSSSVCDVRERPCRKVFIDADNFQDSDHLACAVQQWFDDGSLSEGIFEGKAEFLSDQKLACPIPDLHISAGRAAVRVAVRVTYDGRRYSNALPLTVYDSVCLLCSDDGCRPKDNYCLIDNACYRDGDVKADDVTKTCKTSVNSRQWSSVQSQHPGTPTDTYPDVSVPTLQATGNVLTCTLTSNAHAPSARFEVTWLVDDREVPGLKTVLSANQRHAYTMLQDLPRGESAKCQVRSFYDGGSDDDVSATFVSNAWSLFTTASLDG